MSTLINHSTDTFYFSREFSTPTDDGSSPTAYSYTSSSLADGLHQARTPHLEVALRYALIVIGVVGILSNGFVVLVIAKYKAMLKSVANVYILNQSVIDAAASMSLLLFYILNDERRKPMSGLSGEVLCCVLASGYVIWSLMTSSTTNLVALTLERYFGITRPLWHKVAFTRQRALVSLPFIWLVG